MTLHFYRSNMFSAIGCDKLIWNASIWKLEQEIDYKRNGKSWIKIVKTCHLKIIWDELADPLYFYDLFWPLEMTKNDLKFQNVEFASFYFNRWLPVNGSQIWVGWSRNDFNRCKKIGETFFIPNWEESKTRNSHSRKPIYFGSRLTRTWAVFESRAI